MKKSWWDVHVTPEFEKAKAEGYAEGYAKGYAESKNELTVLKERIKVLEEELRKTKSAML